MRKFLSIAVLLFMFGSSVDVHGKFIVEEEVRLDSSDINGEEENSPPPVSQPEVNLPPATPEVIQPEIQPEPENVSKPSVPVNSYQKEDEEKTEETFETETVSETETEEAETEEITETENVDSTEITEETTESIMETEAVEQETEINEIKETEMLETENTEVREKRRKTSAKIELEKIFGIVCILMAVMLYLSFLYSRVKIYSLSANNRYCYIGRCRAVKKNGIVKIYASKWVLYRGKTGEYKIVLDERLLGTKNLSTVYLILPEQEKIDIGIVQELKFSYH